MDGIISYKFYSKLIVKSNVFSFSWYICKDWGNVLLKKKAHTQKPNQNKTKHRYLMAVNSDFFHCLRHSTIIVLSYPKTGGLELGDP